MGGRVSIFSATSLGGTLSVCGTSDQSDQSDQWNPKTLRCALIHRFLLKI